MTEMVRAVLSAVLSVSGVGCMLVSALGVLRLPDFSQDFTAPVSEKLWALCFSAQVL